MRVHTVVSAGDEPVIMLTAPIPATRKASQRSGLSLERIGAFEVKEALAPVPMVWPAGSSDRPALVPSRALAGKL